MRGDRWGGGSPGPDFAVVLHGAGAVGGVRAAGGGEQLDAREVAVRRRTVQRARALRIGEIRRRAALDELAQLVGLAVARALEQLAAIVLGRRRRLQRSCWHGKLTT